MNKGKLKIGSAPNHQVVKKSLDSDSEDEMEVDTKSGPAEPSVAKPSGPSISSCSYHFTKTCHR